MRKKLLVAFLMSLALTFPLTGCGKENTDLDLGGTNNKVNEAVGGVSDKNDKTDSSSVKESQPTTVAEIALYDENNLGKPSDDYVLVSKTFTKSMNQIYYVYDENWNVIKEIHKAKDGETYSTIDVVNVVCKDDEVVSVIESYYDQEFGYLYVYNDKQQKLAFFDKEASPDCYYIYSYDANGDLIKSDCYKYRNKKFTQAFYETYQYDANRNKIRADFYKDGELQQSEGTDYDDKGNEIQHHLYRADGSEPNEYEQYEWIYTYDEFGRVTELKNKGISHGGTSSHFSYEYDSQGALTSYENISMKEKYKYVKKSEFQNPQ